MVGSKPIWRISPLALSWGRGMVSGRGLLNRRSESSILSGSNGQTQACGVASSFTEFPRSFPEFPVNPSSRLQARSDGPAPRRQTAIKTRLPSRSSSRETALRLTGVDAKERSRAAAAANHRVGADHGRGAAGERSVPRLANAFPGEEPGPRLTGLAFPLLLRGRRRRRRLGVERRLDRGVERQVDPQGVASLRKLPFRLARRLRHA